MKVEIEVFTNDQIPEQDRQICFCYGGAWCSGEYGDGWFNGEGIAVTIKNVSHWFYLPERDTL